MRLAICMLMCSCCAALSLAGESLPVELHRRAIACIDLVFKEEFVRAEEEARRIMGQYPSHPAGYFFSAAALKANMEHYGTNAEEKLFYERCNQVTEKAGTLLRQDSEHFWAQFFMAAADGYRAAHERRFGRWLQAFRHGCKAVSAFSRLQKMRPEWVDVDYGIGVYDYWQSSMRRKLWWLPNGPDKREEAIRRLSEVRRRGIYSRLSASKELLVILSREKRYDEMVTLANELLAEYPTNSFFLSHKARALLAQGADHQQAESLCRVSSSDGPAKATSLY